MADLSVVAAGRGNADAAARLVSALAPYRGRLVVWGGANSAWGPVSHYLGLLAAALGEAEDAIRHFEEAIELEEQIGALPYLAHSLDGLATALTARAAAGDAERASESRRRARAIAGRLGLTRLLERMVPAADEWTLARDGDDWVLTAGGEHARLRDGRGLHYLRALLAAPGRDIPALDLAAGGAGLAAAGTGPVLDAAARDAYRRRLDALTADLDAADRAGDRRGGRTDRSRAGGAGRRAEAGGRADRPKPAGLARGRTGPGQRHPDATSHDRADRPGRAARRRAPAQLDQHRRGLPLPARPRRAGALARLGPPGRARQQLREPARAGPGAGSARCRARP